MLWLALHFPALSLEVFTRGSASALPLAVVEKQGNRTWVIARNDPAAERGVRPGMAASAAQALADELVVRQRDPGDEQAALTGLAAWAGRFTPSVSLQAPDGLLLEVGTCLTLHRGLDNLRARVREGVDAMAYSATSACAPTALGAWLLAQAGEETAVDANALEARLARLPVGLLDLSPDTRESLDLVGAHTLGDCLKLPRAGLARRYGQGLLDQLDRALGRLPEPRAFFAPPPRFERRLELPAPVEHAEALLFVARRLLPELEGYLALRQAGVQALEYVCRHEGRPDTVLKLGFVKPVRAASRMLLLLRETLERTVLPAPVYAVRLRARRLQPLHGSSPDLFQRGEEAGDGDLLLERLRVRLGRDAVYGVEAVADHRPERAWRRCEAGTRTKPAAAPKRPLWLLPRPLPCRNGDLVLKGAVERIESGWWDGRDATRDYYVAQDRAGARLWVYCERATGEWFVHGLFA
ncbi:conserved hypothetical protein [Thiobacillus denitrificans ATCC 25259]|uniref:UmuC domain-containing protein n=1 Tax=Thiobacillus denitrificans (strain ATCC 25259 / T1) TaxID=292415 RepID=Q3SEZ7_THIDA|nr:DNA polymerase Y family protein [Thiobacillus denitrificans]AAZ96782.1 conserved hypothetical protein [Thiobacillus denitrificans ATCC 25259]